MSYFLLTSLQSTFFDAQMDQANVHFWKDDWKASDDFHEYVCLVYIHPSEGIRLLILMNLKLWILGKLQKSKIENFKCW